MKNLSRENMDDIKGPPLGDISEPLAGLLNRMITDRASDLHIDPVYEGVTIRFRINGIIRIAPTITLKLGERLLNQIKVAANLKLDGNMVPQEGLIVVSDGNTPHDFRVTTAPILNCEAAHLRFISADWRIDSLNQLGLNEKQLELISKERDAESGLTLIAGSTGCGKTTTLYALVNAFDLTRKIGTSIEDPIEFRIDGLRQIEVDEEHGITMSEGLRTLLRMDPDVIVVGEIRDQDSAIIASRAALSGRMVMATIHASEPAAAVLAIENQGVPPYILGGALRLIIVQDLVPQLCPDCRKEIPISSELRSLYEKYEMESPKVEFQRNGCKSCDNYGISGRVGVFQIAPVDKAMGYKIGCGISQHNLGKMFAEAGSKSLVHDALEKAALGNIEGRIIQKLALTHRALS
ncbi:MAG: type II secretory ATPase GspE/PulE/Tfp pilus assembly ATPase PilB-like protein [Cryomorphaceae bacterium]|jgi:type II secretory ATPase GspE/PulE/Tfp pilus assembly ATPase PilB-like protein